jgi:Leucine-rich repeat (LRR) protein
MDYKEIFAKIKSFGSDSVHDYLKKNPGQKPGGIDEMLLAIATTDITASTRKNFKTLISKIGGEPTKKALEVVTKRNYTNDSGSKNLLADLHELEKIEGFNTPQFAKYLHVKWSSLTGGREYFLEKATNDEIKYFLLNELYVNDEPENVRLYVGDKVSDRVAKIIWEILPEMAHRVRSFTCRTDGKVDVAFDSIDMPNIYDIKIGGDFDKFPSFVFDQPSLHKLNIRTNLSVFPEGVGKLTNLKELIINMPVTALPDDIFSLTEITGFYLYNTRLTAVPEAIGNFVKLKNIGLSIEDNPEMRTIPESLFALPNLPEVYKRDIRADFMPANEYEALYNSVEFLIREFKGLPLVAELIAKYKAGEEPNYFAELAMAVSKCYYEDEHGRSLGTYYSWVDKAAPEKLKEVNKALKSFKYIDELTTPEDYDKMRKKLQPFEWFDTEKFIALCELMVADIYEKYPFEKW